MSEPMIKPAGPRMCPRCHQAMYGHWCSFDDVNTVALYTHDDLVAVALTTLAEQAAVFDAESERIAHAVVERLTRGAR